MGAIALSSNWSVGMACNHKLIRTKYGLNMKNGKKQTNKEASVIFSVYYVRQIIRCSAPAHASSPSHHKRLTVWYTFSKNAIRNLFVTIFMINYILIVFYVIFLLVTCHAMRNFHWIVTVRIFESPLSMCMCKHQVSFGLFFLVCIWR